MTKPLAGKPQQAKLLEKSQVVTLSDVVEK
jgi:hypothetical protein